MPLALTQAISPETQKENSIDMAHHAGVSASFMVGGYSSDEKNTEAESSFSKLMASLKLVYETNYYPVVEPAENAQGEGTRFKCFKQVTSLCTNGEWSHMGSNAPCSEFACTVEELDRAARTAGWVQVEGAEVTGSPGGHTDTWPELQTLKTKTKTKTKSD